MTSSAAVRPSTRSPARRSHHRHQQRPDIQAIVGAAIVLDDDAVLRNIDQTTGQVTRVCRLQRRIGQTLTGAVGRVEVLKNGQAFLEVRDDRRFDDLARRLGHQAAHTGQLLHLAGEPRAPEWPSCRSS